MYKQKDDQYNPNSYNPQLQTSYNQYQRSLSPAPYKNDSKSMNDPNIFANQSSFSLSRQSRSRSHSRSRDPTPKYNYQDQNPELNRNLENNIKNDPLYYKNPMLQPSIIQPNFNEYDPRGPNIDKPLYYEYEKNITKHLSNSFYGDDDQQPNLKNSRNAFEMGGGYQERSNNMYPGDRRDYAPKNFLKRSRDNNYIDYPETGFEKLFTANTITMKPYFADRSYGHEIELFYYIYPGELNRTRNIMEPPLFSLQYKSGFCSKYCLTADCRPIDIVIRHPSGKEFLHLTRECSCTFLCSQRPKMFVKYVEEGSQGFNLGTIYNPFVCCDYELHIALENGAPRYYINSDICACNLYCCCNCDTCNKSTFSIFDANYSPISKIELLTDYECCRPNISEADHYILHFPPYSSREDRALLLACLVFIDCRYMANSMERV